MAGAGWGAGDKCEGLGRGRGGGGLWCNCDVGGLGRATGARARVGSGFHTCVAWLRLRLGTTDGCGTLGLVMQEAVN